MGLSELYTVKGELTTQIEIAQARLQSVNQQIVGLINKQNKAEEPAKQE